MLVNKPKKIDGGEKTTRQDYETFYENVLVLLEVVEIYRKSLSTYFALWTLLIFEFCLQETIERINRIKFLIKSIFGITSHIFPANSEVISCMPIFHVYDARVGPGELMKDKAGLL